MRTICPLAPSVASASTSCMSNTSVDEVSSSSDRLGEQLKAMNFSEAEAIAIPIVDTEFIANIIL
jgi:hypothetical protein